MPAYNFRKRFADDVEQGRKLNTIRPKRKRATKAGEPLMLYTAQRTSDCRILRKTTCTAVQPVEIHCGHVVVDGQPLGKDEITQLALSDGFEDSRAFFAFFVETYGLCCERPLLNMELIKWEPLAVTGEADESI